ncbi:cartilage oligomeric matrix protein-like isoform X2 [Nematostella vectensis]|uniref:cartilage oligomeric matrix protein-like isoform X2 n=1 Tax=Nematostella vectensis TaxID=45351 RepID=UPI002076F586|nr:cartilage oligomeric matrix protein-like isoform X2 [Nematostella vectensis]
MDALRLLTLAFLVSRCCQGLELDLLKVLKESSPADYGIHSRITSRGESFSITQANKPIEASSKLLQDLIHNIESSREFFIVANGNVFSRSSGALFSIVHSRRNLYLMDIILKGPSNEKQGKFVFKYRLRNGTSHSLSFRKGIEGLYDGGGNYHSIVFHAYDSGFDTTNLDLYIDCKLMGRKQTLSPITSIFSYKGISLSRLDFRIGQRRGPQGSVRNKWKGYLRQLDIVFKRKLEDYVGINKCNREGSSYHDSTVQAAVRAPTPVKSPGPPINQHVLTQSMVADLMGLIMDIRYDLSTQAAEVKYLRKIVENCQMCRVRDFCRLKPCYPGVPCINDPTSDQGFECGDCPLGMEGNGINCTDIDECIFSPCADVSVCYNRNPGYWCAPCPAGYRGTKKTAQGIGRYDALTKKQVCEDIDECAENTELCSSPSTCINTIGSFRCTPCPNGYTGDPLIACTFLNYCDPKDHTSNPCSLYARCIPLRGGRDFRCECAANYAGNGIHCGRDRDHDGFPDAALNCSQPNCKADNCPSTYNKGQDDLDKDGVGDACDDDIDGDGINNDRDNCVLIPNPAQYDYDADTIGDACDNCPYHSNLWQGDIDEDGIGDKCDHDKDGDGIHNDHDNCPTIPNMGQTDTDGDKIGDKCDNCPNTPNKGQGDKDYDLLGDECDTNLDNDRDGVDDSIDNCLGLSNPDQIDNDGDGKGDPCDDDDDDNDGIPDDVDNCRLVPNPTQRDLDGDGRGDECQGDFDADGIPDVKDACPSDRNMQKTNFRRLQTLVLDNNNDRRKWPEWHVDQKGTAVRQTKDCDPSIAVGHERFRGVDFNGTMYVDTRYDDDFIGLVFSFQDAKHFYVISWKQAGRVFWSAKPFRATAIAGIQIKAVKSSEGPSPMMRNAMWHSGNTPNEVKMIWKDAIDQGWKPFTKYHFQLKHRPSIGLIRLRVFEDNSMFIDTGNLWDTTHAGGRLGMYTFSQPEIVWDNLSYLCNEDIPSDALEQHRKRIRNHR